jgi:hypothetical protein
MDQNDCPDRTNHHLYTRCGTCGTRFARLARTRQEFEALAANGVIAVDYILAEAQRGEEAAAAEDCPF